MRSLGYPVIFDVTHSLQFPGGQGASSGGRRNSQRQWHGLPQQQGLTDSSWRCIPTLTTPPATGRKLDEVEKLLKTIKEIHEVVLPDLNAP
jgi:2-dehydro-3-deoxyphosphooctonate aldolase (KDO 8-P synthase)